MTSDAAPLRLQLTTRWRELRDRADEDPFTNAYLLFALDLNRRIAAGEITTEDLGGVVQSVSAEGALERASRLCGYLGLSAGVSPAEQLGSTFEQLADQGFDVFAQALKTPSVGLVTTGHPTFALSLSLSQALAELATGQTDEGAPLGAAERKARETLIAEAPHGPPPELTLDVEHTWAVRALINAADALDLARRQALAVARARWPDRWRTLHPGLMTLATWVGFDQDGRSDVTWLISLGKRLALKEAALKRYLHMSEPLGFAKITGLLTRALERVSDQLQAAPDETDAPAVAEFARRLALDRADSLVEPGPVLAAIDDALKHSEDEGVCETLLVLRAGLETQGVCLAHIHVRLNSTQIHNAVRREVGLETSPSDPANRRSYIQAADRLIEGCKPVVVGFQSLMAETASAKRLFMTIAQMARYVDASAPVRFLIAETESGFTLLAAQYLARLFGVEDLVELSPLFETEGGLTRGEVVIEEALRSPHFRAYLKRQGRLALEFGFSDSGRFIGQMAATFRIERLRLRLAELIEREGLSGDLQVILFNTHGESIGRGGHPESLADRLSYAAPPRDRREFARRAIRTREEDSFQGGEGYLPLFTPAAARASVAGMLSFALLPSPEAEGDPIYDAPNFASEFFATIQQAFTTLAGEPDYAALLSLYGTRLLSKTGSRPEQRQSSETGSARTFTHVSELRAIPNNGILQGLGALANTTYGVARAAAKDPDTYAAMVKGSPRFRRALAMVDLASRLSDLQALRAYAATVNPSLWLDHSNVAAAPDGERLHRLTRLAERSQLTGRLSSVLRHMRSEPAPRGAADDPRRERAFFLHALRIALIQRVCLLAAHVPQFTPRAGFSLEQAQMLLMRLDIPNAVEQLKTVFPRRPDPEIISADFGEADAYLPSEEYGYAAEHQSLFEPLLALHALLLRTTTALNHECGACG